MWTSFKVGPIAYTAWGRRGRRLQFKKHGSCVAPLIKLEIQKRNKGYKPVDEFMLSTVFPNFKESLEQELGFAMLAGKIK